MVHIYLTNVFWPLIVLLSFCGIFLVEEIFVFFAANKNFKFNSPYNILIIILLPIYSGFFFVELKGDFYTNYLLPTINLLTWVELTN